MDLSHWIWLATAAYSVHILEEFMLDWRDWARHVIGLPVEWSDFYVVNAIVIALGICAANLANAAPAIALAYPALLLINGIFFHILPVIKTRGRFSPGVITAVLLFLPIGILSYCAADRAGVLNASTLICSILIGAALMASPIVFLTIKSKPYFRQDHA
jgi:hypothetical protein